MRGPTRRCSGHLTRQPLRFRKASVASKAAELAVDLPKTDHQCSMEVYSLY